MGGSWDLILSQSIVCRNVITSCCTQMHVSVCVCDCKLGFTEQLECWRSNEMLIKGGGKGIKFTFGNKVTSGEMYSARERTNRTSWGDYLGSYYSC